MKILYWIERKTDNESSKYISNDHAKPDGKDVSLPRRASFFYKGPLKMFLAFKRKMIAESRHPLICQRSVMRLQCAKATPEMVRPKPAGGGQYAKSVKSEPAKKGMWVDGLMLVLRFYENLKLNLSYI